LYSISYEWPWALTLLLILPLFNYLEKRFTSEKLHKGVKFSRLDLLERTIEGYHDTKRQLFKYLFIFAVVTGTMALSRPSVVMETPVSPVRLMLVFDISMSMEARDIKPDRLTAARDTALEFLKNIPKGTKVGIEYFHDNAYVAVNPTSNVNYVISSLSSLGLKDLKPGTAIGSAIDAAVDSFSIDKPKNSNSVIILLTDGESNSGILPVDAANIAKKEKIRIYTVGIGSREGAVVQGGLLTVLDEGTLMEIANITGGKYYRAESRNDLSGIYKNLRTKALSLEKQKIEISALLSGMSFLAFLILIYLELSIFRPIF
jgi:Ca-activated chloride channel family protein